MNDLLTLPVAAEQSAPGLDADSVLGACEVVWIQRVIAEPLEERRQADGRYVLWGLVPEAQNRALRVITLGDRETVHNAFFDRGFLKVRTRSQPSAPAVPPAP